LSSPLEEKNQKMTTSFLAHHCLLQLKKEMQKMIMNQEAHYQFLQLKQNNQGQ
jgi:hypothetical protein